MLQRPCLQNLLNLLHERADFLGQGIIDSFFLSTLKILIITNSNGPGCQHDIESAQKVEVLRLKRIQTWMSFTLTELLLSKKMMGIPHLLKLGSNAVDGGQNKS